MKIARYFIKEAPADNARTDYTGFIPMWVPRSAGFDPALTCQGLLHDMLDHRLNDRGHFHEEVMAFGRIIATRVETGVVRPSFRNNSRGEDMGEELMSALNDLLMESAKTQEDFLIEAPHVSISLGSSANEHIRDVCTGFKALNKCMIEGDEEGSLKPFSAVQMANFKNWLKLGYVDARRRYGNSVADVGHAYAENNWQDRKLDRLTDEAPMGSILRAVLDTANRELKLSTIEPSERTGTLPQWARLRALKWRTDRV